MPTGGVKTFLSALPSGIVDAKLVGSLHSRRTLRNAKATVLPHRHLWHPAFCWLSPVVVVPWCRRVPGSGR